MITYLINFTLCSALLLLSYHLLLKNKSIYQFNRFFLLFSVLFSLAVPFIRVKKDAATLPAVQILQPKFATALDNRLPDFVNSNLPTNSPVDYSYYIPFAVYGFITFLLLLRFFRNLYTIRGMITHGTRVKYKQIDLVLTDSHFTPHTFLKFIFLNKEVYHQGQIEKEILQHELTHARQLHSMDVILIELLQAVCWFNPFIILYRRAIQLNHEFIADNVVLEFNHNIKSYQNLLLAKLGQLQSLTITSQFNYSITKKRLIMMSKTTSATTAWFSRLAIIPVITVAFILFCTHTEAQQGIDSAKKTAQAAQAEPGKMQRIVSVSNHDVYFSARPYPSTKNGITAGQMTEYVSYEQQCAARRLNFNKTMPEPVGELLEKLFQQMSPEQQKNRVISFEYPPGALKGSLASRRQFETWKDPLVYGIWVNGKRIKNAALKNYDPNQFVVLFFSRLTNRAVKYDGFHYQIELMTKPYYQNYREQEIANRNNSMIVFHFKS